MIVDSKKMMEIDAKTIAEAVPGLTLMENAGKRTAVEIMKRYRSYRDVYIFAGPGNNGGDGYVIARYLIKKNFNVTTFVLCGENQIKGDARVNFEKLKPLKCPVMVKTLEQIKKTLRENSHFLIVDAIFGTGLVRDVSGLYLEAIDFMNSLRCPVVAVDIPSGISGDDGRLRGNAVMCDLTIAFQLPKFGHFIYPGKKYRGILSVVDIGIPSDIIRGFEIKNHLLTKDFFKEKIIPRSPNTHKNTYGHAVTFAGSVGKAGAGLLVSKAALRAGAGLVTLLAPESIYITIATQVPEVMVEPIHTVNAMIDFLSFKNTFEKMNRVSAVASGPGIGLSEETEKILCYLLDQDIPLIIDADGIRLLKNHLQKLKKRKSPTILTPHPGEFAFLLGKETARIQASRLSFATEFATSFSCHLLLKGNDTIIVTPEGYVSINTSGNPAMANAGQGDALTGFITGLVSSGYGPREALELAAFLHGLSGDFISREKGPVGVLATDIIDAFPQAFKFLTPPKKNI